MARLNAGVVALRTEAIHLAGVVREAADILAPAAAAKLQSLTVTVQSHPVINGDAARLRQVLVNLVGNAVKFTPQGGTITVSISEFRETEGSVAELRVTDTGPGIPAAEQVAIFEPYYRSETAALLPGVGLGLAISRGLVEQMGGTLAVESEIGRGSSFLIRFSLPSPSLDA